jgi:hypothetical protein
MRLKAALRNAPVALRKRGGFLCFRSQTRTYRGITKLLHALHSDAEPPTDAEWRGAWQGQGGGRRRGVAVDRQLTKAINSNGPVTFTLAKTVLAALRHHGMRAVLAQRGVCDEQTGLATAVDFLARDGSDLVLIELKCGFPGDKTRPATRAGAAASMSGPLAKAKDCTANRHFAQLSATLAMFLNEAATLARLQRCGVKQIRAAVLYADTGGSEMFPLPAWWQRRGRAILDSL